MMTKNEMMGSTWIEMPDTTQEERAITIMILNMILTTEMMTTRVLLSCNMMFNALSRIKWQYPRAGIYLSQSKVATFF